MHMRPAPENLTALWHKLAIAKCDFSIALSNTEDSAAQQQANICAAALAYASALRQYRIGLLASCSRRAIPRHSAMSRTEIGRIRRVA